MKIEREVLIQICKDAVVHHTKWGDRDSYSAQKEIRDIYKGLTAGLEYKIITKEDDPEWHTTDETIVIEFLQPIDEEKLKAGLSLEISSREMYFKDCDPEYESEMFDGNGIDFESEYTKGYMPTRKRLDQVGPGNDWY